MLQLQQITASEGLFVLVLLMMIFLFIFCLYLIDKNAELSDTIYMQDRKLESTNAVLSDINNLVVKFNQSLTGKE